MQTKKALLTALALISLVALGCSRDTTDSASGMSMGPPSSEELASLLASDGSGEKTFVIDVRTPEEFQFGAIPGAVNTPVSTIAQSPPTEDRSAPIVVYCLSGARSRTAKGILEGMGYTNVRDFGAITRWQGKLN